MLKTFIRPAMIFIPLAAGILCPQAAGMNFLVRYLIMIMLMMVFLGLNLREIRLRRSHFLLLLANWAIGILSWLTTWFITSNTTLAQAAFFVGITPTATAAAVVMSMLNGNVGYVLTAFMLTNVGTACILPGLLGVVCGNVSWNFMLRVLESLVFLMLIPYVVSLIIRKLYPPAMNWPKRFKNQTFLLWSFSLFIIAATAAEFFQQNPEVSWWIVLEIAFISLLICILNFTLGYFLGERQLRREASQSLGQKNTTLTIYLALVYAGPLASMGVIFYVLWHNSYNALQMFWEDRCKNRPPQTQQK